MNVELVELRAALAKAEWTGAMGWERADCRIEQLMDAWDALIFANRHDLSARDAIGMTRAQGFVGLAGYREHGERPGLPIDREGLPVLQ